MCEKRLSPMTRPENEKESIALIDKLKPMLTGKNSPQLAATLYCISLFCSMASGFMFCIITRLDLEQPHIIYRFSILTLILIVLAIINVLSVVSFLKLFKKLIQSPDSKKDPWSTDRPAQPTETAHPPQGSQPKETASKPHESTPRVD